MWQTLNWLQKNLVWSVPLSMLAGLVLGQLANPGILRNTILPLTLLMVYPMMVTMNIRDLIKPGNGRLHWVAQTINFILMPGIGYAAGWLFFEDQPMVRLALMLASLLPTSGMTISWTGFAKGNVPAAVKMTVVGLISGSLLAPLYLKVLLGTVTKIPILQVFGQIALIVFLPLVLGSLTRGWLIQKHGEPKFNQQLKPKFPPLSTLGVVGIVFVSMALKSQDIFARPSLLPSLLWPLVLIYAVNFVISSWVGKVFFQRGDAIALVYGTVMRNLSIALAIAMGVFGPEGAEAALLIALAYIVQVQAAAWYVKLTDRLFGPAPAKTA